MGCWLVGIFFSLIDSRLAALEVPTFFTAPLVSSTLSTTFATSTTSSVYLSLVRPAGNPGTAIATTSTPASTTAESQTTDAAPKSAINYETDPKFQAPKEQTADTATAAVAAATTGVVDTQVSSGGAVATESTPTTTGATGTQTTETTTNGTPTQQTTQAAATPAVKQTDRYKTVEGTTYNNGKWTSSVVEDASGKKYIKTEELGKMPKYTEITEDDFATIQQAQQQRAQQASAPSGDGTVLTNAKPNVIESD